MKQSATENEKNILKLYKKGKAIGLHLSASNWYNDANSFCQGLSARYSVELNKVCAVVSALSPAVSWETNKRDAENLIAAYSEFITVDMAKQSYSFSTYFQNVLKAEKILHSDRDPLEFFSIKTGAKTRSFYLNILNPDTETSVTIDRHAVAIWLGVNKSYAEALTPKKYGILEQAYKNVAKKLKLLPHQLQAITWVTYKQINSI